jgi:hypothetical protein
VKKGEEIKKRKWVVVQSQNMVRWHNQLNSITQSNPLI